MRTCGSFLRAEGWRPAIVTRVHARVTLAVSRQNSKEVEGETTGTTKINAKHIFVGKINLLDYRCNLALIERLRLSSGLASALVRNYHTWIGADTGARIASDHTASNANISRCALGVPLETATVNPDVCDGDIATMVSLGATSRACRFNHSTCKRSSGAPPNLALRRERPTRDHVFHISSFGLLAF